MIRPFESEYLDDKTWVVYTRCPECGRLNCLEVTPQQLSELEFAAEHLSEGKLIQDILPDHSKTERENTSPPDTAMIAGTLFSAGQWRRMFRMSYANYVSSWENPFRLTVAWNCRRDRFPTAPAMDYNHPPKDFKPKNNKKKVKK